MKKSDLKQLIKPLVKECIHEVLIEEGLLSDVVAEVAKGMQGNLVVETKQKKTEHLFSDESRRTRKSAETSAKLNEHRKKLMNSIGTDAYNGVDLFEGTQALSQREVAAPSAGSIDLGSPSDAGVDISSLMGGASKIWQAMK